MTALVADPLGSGGIEAFGTALRAGRITCEAATRAYLDRIDAVDGRLGAYQHVSHDSALATARAMDALLAAGTDLGTLMGVPVAVKDLLVVDGMPTTAGSRLDISDHLGPEGPVVAGLRRAGCIILGKTKTVEFAFGVTGVSEPLGTPWNPWDAQVQRLPGGSSSGSGVATAAGLCAFAIGTDTGGSVRIPAALNGVFGLKTSIGRWATDGVFPLAPHLDTVGLLTRSAADARLAFSVLSAVPTAPEVPLSRLRFGRPDAYFFDALSPEVETRIGDALTRIAAEAAVLSAIDVPEAPERERYFPAVLPACLIAGLGRDRLEREIGAVDPVVAKRIESGFDGSAAEVLALEEKRSRSRQTAHARFAGLDAWVSPTTAAVSAPVAELDDPARGFEVTLGMTRATQPANYLDLCAASLPLPMGRWALPAGLQLMMPAGREEALLAAAVAVECVLGMPLRPDVSPFLRI